MLRKLLHNDSGNVAILFAIGAVPILLAVGASVDMVRANRAEAILQAASDAAVLSAAAGQNLSSKKGGATEDHIEGLVESYLAANDISSAVDEIMEVDTDINKKKGTLTVKVRGKMKTALMGLAGIDNMELNAMSEVSLGSRAMEVAFVLDNTGSMSGQKLLDLKAAANGLVSTLFSQKADYARLSIGVVPYSEYVNVGIDPPGGGWLDSAVTPAGSLNEGCVGSRPSPENASIEYNGSNKYPSVGGVHCVQQLLPLTTDRAAVEGVINAMVAEGNTYIPGGLLWGWNILTHEAPYTEGMKPKEMLEFNGSKALILMTDGENTISANGALHDGPDGEAPDLLTAELCEKVKADGITVFTVAFQVPSPEIKDILEKCASDPAMAFDAGNATALNAAFNAIGAKLSALYLTK
jgi:Flp pilus assembly protein TadG